jgi:hypothetical protein
MLYSRTLGELALAPTLSGTLGAVKVPWFERRGQVAEVAWHRDGAVKNDGRVAQARVVDEQI